MAYIKIVGNKKSGLYRIVVLPV